jgi:hypothetical protein
MGVTQSLRRPGCGWFKSPEVCALLKILTVAGTPLLLALIATQVSPWPGALLIRLLFDLGGYRKG